MMAYDLITFGASSNIADYITENVVIRIPSSQKLSITVDSNVEIISGFRMRPSYISSSYVYYQDLHHPGNVNEDHIIGWVCMDIQYFMTFIQAMSRVRSISIRDIKILQAFAGSRTDPPKAKSRLEHERALIS